MIEFTKIRKEVISSIVNGLDKKEKSNSNSNTVMIQDFDPDCLFLDIDGNETYENLKKNHISSLGFFFDQLCIFSSLFPITQNLGNFKNSTLDLAESFLLSLPVYRFREKMGKLIDSLLERNGYISLKDEKDDLSNAYNSNSSQIGSGFKNLTHSIQGFENLKETFNTTNSSSKRKNKPKRIVTKDSILSTEFLISPKKNRLKSRYSNLGISNGDEKCNNKNVIRVMGNSEPSKSLSRHSSANLLRNPFESSPKEHNLNSNGVRRIRTCGSLSSLSSDKSNSKKGGANFSGRRSSGKTVQDLKLKLKNEVSIPTNNINKVSNIEDKRILRFNSNPPRDINYFSITKSLKSSISSYPTGIRRNIANSGNNDVKSISSPKRLSNRLFSAPNLVDSTVEATTPIINRNLRRQGRNSSSIWISNIVGTLSSGNITAPQDIMKNTDKKQTEQILNKNVDFGEKSLSEKRTPKRSNSDIPQEQNSKPNQRTQYEIKKNKLQRTF
ncbi:hypothetical protein AYI68_g3136 [Smittium mucronatum]|uniref:Uncharacterized protein n=1 Tax=Smittium mucronatum TaxID=133383 RepID=A0A1R0H0S5_9FUNG|nr:hypothetical protein AYI68_g3136 [Smittium mucronatum]